MIHHISIPVQDARGVAEVLARVLDGRVVEFRPHPEVWTVRTADPAGTAIECFPDHLAMVPSDDPSGVDFVPVSPRSGPTAVHVLISVERTVDELLGIAADVGWRAELVERGAHRVVAFWVENTTLLELVIPDRSDAS